MLRFEQEFDGNIDIIVSLLNSYNKQAEWAQNTGGKQNGKSK